MMQLNNEANIFNIMNFVDDNIWCVIFVVTLVISVILFIRHIFFTKKVFAKYDSIEKYLCIYLAVIFVICFFDKVILDLCSKAYIAYDATKRPDGFIETMFYLIINSRKMVTWYYWYFGIIFIWYGFWLYFSYLVSIYAYSGS